MKKLITWLIRHRNPSFQLDKSITGYLLFVFAADSVVQLVRGTRLLLAGRRPRFLLCGRSVRFFYLPGIRWGRFVRLGDHVLLSALRKESLQLGNNVNIGAFSRLVISTIPTRPGSFIYIGDNVGIGEFAYLGGAGGLTIGNDCIIGQYFSCHPENHVYHDPRVLYRLQGVTRKGIIIGCNCWIGAKVTILDGVHIGANCVIAAGAVVTKDMPANSLVGGVPARVLRQVGQSVCLKQEGRV